MSSLLKTPCNGIESLIDNERLWLEGTVGIELCGLNSRRACLAGGLSTSETDYTKFLGDGK